ncbi:hypothetical protein ACFQY4_29890 [Catellatospora bangladeshensis]|uniref:Secreted protein n=1 Tax=Catellatospora bangladeshensis TaxID=310355 RepID=A0A8J3NGZ1_9ACTN|nr:hypothetical protein [Catellatospora bangladeshensis]GIF80742.1 hypothetical protein Cba03nite_20910 [Catellatospora bangladeshensis]
MDLLNSVLPLFGVVVGAAGAYWATAATERQRWRRTQSTRWDDRRLTAYITYGETSKQIMTIAHRIAAARGLDKAIEPLSPREGLDQLATAIAARQAAWEAVLLLGDVDAVHAARAWDRALWRPVEIVRGDACTRQQWRKADIAVGEARDAFYAAARRDLGVQAIGPLPQLRPPASDADG